MLMVIHTHGMGAAQECGVKLEAGDLDVMGLIQTGIGTINGEVRVFFFKLLS